MDAASEQARRIVPGIGFDAEEAVEPVRPGQPSRRKVDLPASRGADAFGLREESTLLQQFLVPLGRPFRNPSQFVAVRQRPDVGAMADQLRHRHLGEIGKDLGLV